MSSKKGVWFLFPFVNVGPTSSWDTRLVGEGRGHVWPLTSMCRWKLTADRERVSADEGPTAFCLRECECGGQARWTRWTRWTPATSSTPGTGDNLLVSINNSKGTFNNSNSKRPVEGSQCWTFTLTICFQLTPSQTCLSLPWYSILLLWVFVFFCLVVLCVLLLQMKVQTVPIILQFFINCPWQCCSHGTTLKKYIFFNTKRIIWYYF